MLHSCSEPLLVSTLRQLRATNLFCEYAVVNTGWLVVELPMFILNYPMQWRLRGWIYTGLCICFPWSRINTKALFTWQGPRHPLTVFTGGNLKVTSLTPVTLSLGTADNRLHQTLKYIWLAYMYLVICFYTESLPKGPRPPGTRPCGARRRLSTGPEVSSPIGPSESLWDSLNKDVLQQCTQTH